MYGMTVTYFNLRWTAPGFDGSPLLMAGPRGSVPDADAVRPGVGGPADRDDPPRIGEL